MASLLRLSRGFARAARHAAPLVAPPVARLGSGGTAPSDLLRSHRLSFSFLRGGRGSAVDAPPLGRALSSYTDAPAPPGGGRRRFVADDKDLESDEALWALYKRWCKFFNQQRDHDEMVRYFPEFKEAALYVDRVNKANLPYKLGFNDASDGKLRKLRQPECFYLGMEGIPYSKSPMFAIRPKAYEVAGRPEGTGDKSKDSHPEGTGDESNLLA